MSGDIFSKDHKAKGKSLKSRKRCEGFKKYCLVLAARDLDIFDELESPKSIEELSAALKVDKSIVSLCCENLEGLKLIKKVNGRVVNTKLAGKLFSDDCSLNKIEKLVSYRDFVTNRMDHSIFEHSPPEKYVDPLDGEPFEHMIATINIISIFPEFKNARNMLQLGLWQDIYSFAFLTINKDLKCYRTVNDRNEHDYLVGASKLWERIRYSDDPFNRTYDLIFSSNFPERTEEHISKIHSILKREELFIDAQLDRYTIINESGSSFNGSTYLSASYSEPDLANYLEKLDKTGFDILEVLGSSSCNIVVARKK